MATYQGLTVEVAKEKLISIGKNEIPEKRGTWFKKIVSWVFSFISLMLIAAMIISHLNGQTFDSYFIFFLWVLNLVVGFWHEKKADDAIKKLQEKLEVAVKVFRDDKWMDVMATELVPDDVISLSAGKIIPADVTFLEVKNVNVNESALTGESLPKEKHINDTAYSGSFLSTGLAIARVDKTGISTYFGKTLMAVEKSHKRSVLENDILGIARLLSLVSLGAVVILTSVFLVTHQPLLRLLTLDLSLVIAGIPVSLPTVMTLIISLGVTELVKKNIIVRRLSSLEDLSNVDLLLSDKTGTLTKNELAISDIVTFGNHSPHDVITYASAATAINEKSPIEIAVAKRFEEESQKEKLEILDFTPADSERKRSTSVVSIAEKIYTIAMGAPQIIAQLADAKTNNLEDLFTQVKEAADRGYRVLAVGFVEGKSEKDLSVIGLLLISDTPEPDAKETITFMRENGIQTKILTGDNISISERLASEMGLHGIVSDRAGFDLTDKNIIDKEKFDQTVVFSEILPSDKYKLVEMGKKYYRVAVTGDGVNDIPAMKVADVGIAVKKAVDALKGTADIVLLSSGISTIKDAIVEARKIFARLYTYSLYRISESLRLIVSITILGIVFMQYPMTPIQILILALLNDIPIIFLAYNRVHIASKPARIDARRRTIVGSLYGLVGLFNSILFVVLTREILHLDWDTIQTLFFLKLSVGGHLLIYVAHTNERWYKFLPSRIVIFATTLTQIIATLFTIFGIFMSPISIWWAFVVWVWTFFWMQVSELVKIVKIKSND